MCGFPLHPGTGSHAIETGTVEPALDTTPKPSRKQADLVFDYIFPIPLVSLVSAANSLLLLLWGRFVGAQCLVGGRGEGEVKLASNVTSSHLYRAGIWCTGLV